MTDLRTRIADILDDHGLRGATTRQQAVEAILDAVTAESACIAAPHLREQCQRLHAELRPEIGCVCDA